MNNFVVDYETYYKKGGISVTEQGLDNYIKASYAYLVSVVGPGVEYAGSPDEARAKFPTAFWMDPQNQFIAANSNFDRRWTEHCMEVTFARDWQCILDKGAGEQCPHHLKGVVKATGGGAVDKSLRDGMSGIHWAELSEDEKKAMAAYCLKDSKDTLAAWNKLPPLSPIEQKLAEHTRRINRRGVHIDTEVLDDHKTILQAARHAAFHAIPWSQSDKPLSTHALARWCALKGIPVPESVAKTDEICTELMTAHPALNEVIGTLRLYRRTNTMIEKINSVKERIRPDGTIPLEFIYCGARHTRRWSCRGVNIQNLDRDPIRLPMGLLISDELKAKYTVADEKTGIPHVSIWSRHWVVPPPGKLFLVLDYAQIEPRCLNWLVGNEALLDLIRNGYSVYEAYARVAKNWTGDKGTLKKELGLAKYTLIKNEVLGLGYGMGASRYCDYANVDAATAETTVTQFRARNPRITGFWRSLDETIRTAARSQSRDIKIKMPSGEYLRYFHVRGSDGGHEGYMMRGDFSHASKQSRLWGGTLAENVTQRMARDVLGNAVVSLEGAGFDVAFTSHDEGILEVDKDNREDAKAEAVQIMTRVPAWCRGLPLAVEGDFCERYTK